jgi:hypothetical protein
MTFEAHARQRIGLQSDYELNRFTNGLDTSDPALAESPLSDQQLQQMAKDELFFRHQAAYDPVDDL